MRPWGAGAAGLALVLLGLASGQQQLWTVQTAAHRDFRDARRVASSLVELGFDAYTEFAMDRGRQFVRVRIGCFAGRSAAAALARAVAAAVTAEAVPVPMTPDAEVAGCVKIDVGFRKPVRWRQLVGDRATFEVEVAGATATIAHTGLGWQLSQGTVKVQAQPAPAGTTPFEQVFPNGQPMVLALTPRGPIIVCAGRLLDTVATTAIVEQEQAIVACQLEPYPAGTN